MPDMIEDVFPGLCKIVLMSKEREATGGSGFVISSDGLVVTNHHVFAIQRSVPGNTEFRAQFDDGRVYTLQPLASDEEADIAVGRLVLPPGTRMRALRPGSTRGMKRGEPVAVLGAPLSGALVPSVGCLAGIRYVADDEAMNTVLNSRSDWCLLQIDASMLPGNSGGPIVNAAGRVVGVSVLSQASQFGNINYGVSMDQAWPIIHALLTRGSVTRAAIGMTVATVSNETDRQVMASRRTHLLPSSGDYVAGLLVTYIVAHGPAANAGLRTGDVVLAVNGKRMVRKGDYFDALGPVYVPGQELHCIVYRPRAAGDTRDGEVMELTIRPAPKSDLRATRTAFGAR